MAPVESPANVKFFVAVLYGSETEFHEACNALVECWGPIENTSEPYPFDVTDYYLSEMGSPLLRRIVAFSQLRPPTDLVAMKIHCNCVENQLANEGNRTVNLDCGYLDHHKILLASAKKAGQKVYLDRGIYADLAARYKNKKWIPFEWTFPDYRDGRYDSFYQTVRTRYLMQLRSARRTQAQGTELQIPDGSPPKQRIEQHPSRNGNPLSERVYEDR